MCDCSRQIKKLHMNIITLSFEFMVMFIDWVDNRNYFEIQPLAKCVKYCFFDTHVNNCNKKPFIFFSLFFFSLYIYICVCVCIWFNKDMWTVTVNSIIQTGLLWPKLNKLLKGGYVGLFVFKWLHIFVCVCVNQDQYGPNETVQKWSVGTQHVQTPSYTVDR